MKRNDFFPSKYLTAEDIINESGMIVTVKIVTPETMKERETGKDVGKPVMYFNELTKGLVLNKTNWGMLEQITSQKDSDFWNGTQIALTVESVTSYGDIVDAIRIKRPNADDAAVQTFWKRTREIGLTRNEGLTYLANANQNFKQALVDLDKEPEPA